MNHILAPKVSLYNLMHVDQLITFPYWSFASKMDFMKYKHLMDNNKLNPYFSIKPYPLIKNSTISLFLHV